MRRRLRRTLVGLGAVAAAAALVVFAGDEATGLGPANRAYALRAAEARGYGFDPGSRRALARDAAKPAFARTAFSALVATLSTRGAFDPKTHPPASLRRSLGTAAGLARAAEGGSHRDWTKGFRLTLPDLGGLHAAVAAGETLARGASARGDYGEATAILLDAADLARAYRDEPMLVTDWARTRDSEIVLRAAGGLLADPAYPPHEAERLFRMADGPALAATVAPRELQANALTGAHDLLDDPPDELTLAAYDGGARARALASAARLPRVRRAWQSDLLRLGNATARALPGRTGDFARAERAWDALARDAARAEGRAGVYSPGALSPLVMPLWPEWSRGAGLRERRRRVLRMAAGLRAGRSEASLRAGGLGLDPVTGEPLAVRRAGSGRVSVASGGVSLTTAAPGRANSLP